MTDLSFCKDLSIYLGNACNFNCGYCDRDYIKTSIGSQSVNYAMASNVVGLLESLSASGDLPPMLSFHGGEPFYFVSRMHFILSSTRHLLTGTKVFIQSNGSLLSENESFFEEFQDLDLIVSISYDFKFQEENRTTFDLKSALHMLKRYGVKVQLQYVIPLHNPSCFSFDIIREIVDLTVHSGLVSRVNLIPLRHIRGKDKFRLVIEDVDLTSFLYAMVKFVEVLYVLGVSLSIDGHGMGIHKDYFNNHKQLVVSPDGYLYPEYDFLEYQMPETRIGSWNSKGLTVHPVDEKLLSYPECWECPQTKVCGLKYLFKAFEKTTAPHKCIPFYEALTMVTNHSQKLATKKSLVHWMATV